jgi:hypothetical protein
VLLALVAESGGQLVDFVLSQAGFQFSEAGDDLFLGEFAAGVFVAFPLGEEAFVGEAFLED